MGWQILEERIERHPFGNIDRMTTGKDFFVFGKSGNEYQKIFDIRKEAWAQINSPGKDAYAVLPAAKSGENQSPKG